MKKYDIITIGGATEDTSFTINDYKVLDNYSQNKEKLMAFAYGQKIGIKETSKSFGGGAANVAVACARLGLKTLIIAAVGQDEEGKRIYNNLVKHKIDVRLLQTEHGARSSISFVLKTLSNDHVLFTYRGANDQLIIDRQTEKKLTKATRLYLASLTGAWRDVLAKVMATKAKIAWNPGWAQLAAGFSILKPWLLKTDILILNKDEALELYLSSSKDKKVIALNLMIRKIHSFGPRIVVITEGLKGALAFDGKKMIRQKAFKVKAIDTTGVGDAFGATLVASLDHGFSLEQALKFAAKNAANVVTKAGAQNGLLGAHKLGW